MPLSRKGTAWDQVLFVLVAYRLLGLDESLSEIGTLHRCQDRLLARNLALFEHLVGGWRDMFNASFEVLLYGLTTPISRPIRRFPKAIRPGTATPAATSPIAYM